jgi:hypothetical protein
MMRCSVAGGKARSRNLEVAKRGYHGSWIDRGFGCGVEVSLFANPTRAVRCQKL